MIYVHKKSFLICISNQLSKKVQSTASYCFTVLHFTEYSDLPYLNASIFTEKQVCHGDRNKLVFHTLQLVSCHSDLTRVSIAKRA
jgi:hypothetical protein